MLTKQDIINNALLNFGNNTIQSEYAGYVDIKFNVGAQLLLSLDYWNFAQKIVSLGMISNNTELYGYKYKYNLPADLNGIYAIYNKNVPERDYKIVGYNLYSNMFPLDCQYTSSDLATSYPPHFGNCLSYWLAKELCISMGSPSSQPSLIQLYEQALQQAKLINGKDKPSQTYITDYYVSSRY